MNVALGQREDCVKGQLKGKYGMHLSKDTMDCTEVNRREDQEICS